MAEQQLPESHPTRTSKVVTATLFSVGIVIESLQVAGVVSMGVAHMLMALAWAVMVIAVWNWLLTSDRKHIVKAMLLTPFALGVIFLAIDYLTVWLKAGQENRPPPSVGEWLSPVITYVQSWPWRWITVSLVFGFLIAVWLLRVLRYDFAKSEKGEIDKYVIVKDSSFNYDGLEADPPYFTVTFNLINSSVYRISIDPKDVKGTIYRNDEEISGNLKVSPIENLSRGDEPAALVLKQWVSTQELPRLINPILDTVLKFDRVRITVKGGDGAAGVVPKTLRLPSVIPVSETNPPNLRVNELKARIGELETERDAASREFEQLRRRAERAEHNAAYHSMIAKSLEGYKWLHKTAETQAKDIDRYVLPDYVDLKVEDFKPNLNDPMPKVMFGLLVTNYSVFDISLDDKNIDGHILFRGRELTDTKIVRSPIENLEPLKQGRLVIEQRLSPSETKLISESENAIEPNFEFEKLTIPIVGGQRHRDSHPRIGSKPLNLKGKGVNIKGGPLTYGGRAPKITPQKSILITRATYWFDEEKHTDVTQIIASMVSNGGLTIMGKYKDFLLPDPKKGSPKKLTIDYLHDGLAFSVTVAENTILTLPIPYERGR